MQFCSWPLAKVAQILEERINHHNQYSVSHTRSFQNNSQHFTFICMRGNFHSLYSFPPNFFIIQIFAYNREYAPIKSHCQPAAPRQYFYCGQANILIAAAAFVPVGIILPPKLQQVRSSRDSAGLGSSVHHRNAAERFEVPPGRLGFIISCQSSDLLHMSHNFLFL